MQIAGVYVIKNDVNGRSYVGASKDVYDRLKQHRSTLNSFRHFTKDLQADWITHGEECFTFGVLQVVSCANELGECEKFWMDWMEQYGDRYNGKRKYFPVGHCFDHMKNTLDDMRESRIEFRLNQLLDVLNAEYDVEYDGEKVFSAKIKQCTKMGMLHKLSIEWEFEVDDEDRP